MSERSIFTALDTECTPLRAPIVSAQKGIAATFLITPVFRVSKCLECIRDFKEVRQPKTAGIQGLEPVHCVSIPQWER